MSALYLGTGQLERYILETIDKKVKEKKEINVNLLFDYMRGTRVNNDGFNSYELVKQLKLKNAERNIRCGFFHNPDTGYMKFRACNGPLREIFGVHHIKALVFDNTVLITGANLSNDYFTDR